jgi:crossover junction endodeoxyribonuclease RuvC
MIICGIDPGFAITGFGIIKYDLNKFNVLDYGVVSTDAGVNFGVRLKILNEKLEEIIKKYKPEAVAIEELFFSKNTKTAIKVGHGRGVALLTAVKSGCSVYEYTPLQIKQAITGYGRADKTQIQLMVKMLLGLKEIPKPDDAADGLAVAICHAQSHKIENIKYLKRQK